MTPIPTKRSFSAARFVVIFCLLMAAFECPAAATSESISETATNFIPLAVSTGTNTSLRRLLQVRRSGTVQIGGNSNCVVTWDGSTVPYFLPATISKHPLQRGQRIQIEGRCLVEGTNLLLDLLPLIDNDGLHMMVEHSADIWLEPGPQPISVRYFNRTGERGLTVSIEGPGLPLQPIPDSMLRRMETNPATGLSHWTNGLRFRCYEGDWRRLPDFSAMQPVLTGIASNFDITVSRRTDDFGLEYDGFIQISRAGVYRFFCNSDDGSQVKLGNSQLSVQPIGSIKLPELPQLAAGQLIDRTNGSFCATLDGVVTLVGQDDNGLNLELDSGPGGSSVRMLDSVGLDPHWLTGARVLASGICESVFAPGGHQIAGQLTIGSEDNMQVLSLPERLWNSKPILTAADIAASALTNNRPQLIHVRGTLKKDPGSPLASIQDDTGEVILRPGNGLDLESGARVEALGITSSASKAPLLFCYALRRLVPARDDPSRELPLLTTVEQVKQMSRDQANLGYPVKVRGVITFVWPDGGFFLQDSTWSVDVRIATNAPLSDAPQIGDFWEVEGATFAAFAPDILATHAVRLGSGTLPEPEHPNWTQLMDGSMDTQYIEMQGVVVGIQGSTLDLLTPGGRIKVLVPEYLNADLIKFQGALARVRGCLIPGRDPASQQVIFGEFALRNALVTVDEPPPANPFALPLKHATDLLLFESHSSPVERVRLGGIVLLQRNDVAYMLDRTNGVRIVSDDPIRLHPGDQVQVVGFPDLTGPSPVLNYALVHRLRAGPLPEPVQLDPDHLIADQNDSTLVTIRGTLDSQRNNADDRILEMRSGTHLWLARLPLRTERIPDLELGSVLDLTGVYAGRGGDRVHGRDIDSFELLLHSAQDVIVVRAPSWWTSRHALLVAGVLLAVLLLAVIWIGALQRQVEEHTRALKNEIEDHKRTELELENKTEQLTQEIKERVRIEAEVERGHKQLLITSRLAGMAEVATSVLHNVGNVMTSVNVLSNSIVDLVRNSKIPSVARLGELLGKNRNELDRFLVEDERGRKMPDYVGRLGEHLANEQSLLLQKVKVLNENIHHINEIVAMQQNFAKVSGVLETVPPVEVIEDALRMHGESLRRHGIKLVRDFESLPPVTMDRHKILQILFNLLENAKYACQQNNAPEKKIVVSLRRTAAGFMRLSVADNGMGIPPENLERIFHQGFSTRKDGHGFGLHSSVLAAQDMGGNLAAQSPGPGKGATFTLEIPMSGPANHL